FFELLPPLHRLSIRSNIDKTAIYVKCKDGKKYSGIASTKTPFNLEAVAGACTITATKKGYKELTQSATLPTNKEISLQLVAIEKKRKEKNLTPDKKKQQVKQPQKKPTASPTVQSTSNPVPAASTPKPDPLQIKTEKKGCQNELSVGMPELCD
ncbi:MAG: hypothetical protein D3910_16970, partial [Candidatus Electrothrix sp. ATG2]|nr:hypothetical protein [Candidatus Electrothrix sp. ATG2]